MTCKKQNLIIAEFTQQFNDARRPFMIKINKAVIDDDWKWIAFIMHGSQRQPYRHIYLFGSCLTKLIRFK